jgi:hypothetical protein
VMAPTGRMQAAIPTTKMEMGSVANMGDGASLSPTMDAVAYTTTEFAPANAWAMESRQIFPRCTLSGSMKEELAAELSSVMQIVPVDYALAKGRIGPCFILAAMAGAKRLLCKPYPAALGIIPRSLDRQTNFQQRHDCRERSTRRHDRRLHRLRRNDVVMSVTQPALRRHHGQRAFPELRHVFRHGERQRTVFQA